MYREKLTDYLPDIMEMLRIQLEDDDKRWGDTWKKRPIGDYKGLGDQYVRAYARITDYQDRYVNANVPFPIFKALGEYFILAVRELELRTSGELDSGEKNEGGEKV